MKQVLQNCEGLVVPEDNTIYAYGYRKKPLVILIDATFQKRNMLIRRYLWLKGGNEREYINIYPSCVVKYCPFILDNLEWIEANNISQGKYTLNGLEDPLNILQSADPIHRWIKKITKKIDATDTIAHLAYHYTALFGSLPIALEPPSKPSVIQQ